MIRNYLNKLTTSSKSTGRKASAASLLYINVGKIVYSRILYILIVVLSILPNTNNLFAACTAPTTHASGLTASNIAGTSMTLSWTRGNGTNILIVARLTATANVAPSNGTNYTPNAVFGSGGTTGANNYVVYVGNGTDALGVVSNRVNITNMTAASYTFLAYEFNDGGCGTPVYRTAATVPTLAACFNVPEQPGIINGNVLQCSGATAQTYSVAAVAGASSYTWTAAGWTTGGNTNSISVTAGASTTLNVTATNACGTSAARTLAITSGNPPTPASITSSTSSYTTCVSTPITLLSAAPVGGIVTTSGVYRIHTFSTVGSAATFTTSAGFSGNVDVLLVGAGGNGEGGGGGGGGVIYSSSTVAAATSYGVTVGNGGATQSGSYNTCGANGGASSFNGLSADGGGYGCGDSGNGGTGGSGGGGGWCGYTGSSATANQGYGGGASQNIFPSQNMGANGGGGGGGACGRGAPGTATAGGGGGAGYVCSITGSPITYGGGGGGGVDAITGHAGGTAGSGGAGGGGAGGGTATAPSAGTDGLGGGGGGQRNEASTGYSGGSGVVIIRYANVGSWYSSNTGVATINVSTGVVTPIAVGTAVMTYSVSVGTCSSIQTATVTITDPAQPGGITGTTQQCPSVTGQTYSIAAVSGASSYTWAVPAGWNITGGTGTTSITVTAGTAGQNGNVSVAVVNGGCSTTRILEVASSLPPTPATITGTNSVCVGATTIFTSTLPTGGTVTTSGGYRIHSFTTAGGPYTLTVPTGFAGNVEALVVGGGGGGGYNGGGGGAAGGLTFNPTYALTSGTDITNITVGAGGSGAGGNASGSNGSSSVFGTITATYGGGGGSRCVGCNAAAGGSGGGGGGGQNPTESTAAAAGGSGTANAGGNGSGISSDLGNWSAGGGGGGAGSAGRPSNCVNTSYAYAGNGGLGLSYSISGSPTYYAGGGGGGATSVSGPFAQLAAGTGGSGVGGSGACYNNGTAAFSPASAPGTANTGSGGGGCTAGGCTGGSGGSGIVIVRYPTGSWVSSNTAVATVSSTGVVSGVGIGTSTITYSVSANGCSSTSTRVVTVVPATPGPITGTVQQCPGATGQTYSIAAVGGATTYTWAVPTGWTITGGTGTTSITVTVGSAGQNGNISVTETSGGVVSGARILEVSSTALPTLGALAGSSTVCSGSTTTLSYTATPTGGTITTSGGYRIHTFTTGGNFVTPAGFSANIEVLTVAGGGGGGGGGTGGGAAGGGGGGGYIHSASYPVVASSTYAVVVGGGGSGGAANSMGSNGNNSTFNAALTATGGGGGAYYNGTSNLTANSGGSGGGGGSCEPGVLNIGGAGTTGQGFAGGAGSNGYPGGGGGGAGAAGQDAATGDVGGNGGSGIYYSISGASVGYAGGGAGSGRPAASQGTATNGGGTVGSLNGTANTGGGGAGGNATASPSGSNGGSGIVIVRYPDLSAGTWSSGTPAVATVNSSGDVTGVANGTSTITYSVSLNGCSSTVTKVVTVVTTTITSQPVSALVDAAAGTPNASFTVVAAGPGAFTYQWQDSIFGATWTNVSGAVYSGTTTSATLTLTAPSASLYNGHYYRCRVSGTCSAVYTNGTSILYVNTAAIAFPCAGYDQNYNINPPAANTTYTWAFPSGWVVISNSSSGTSVNDGVIVNPSTTSGTMTVTPSTTCGGTGTALTFSVSVANVTTAATATLICTGQSVTVTATPVFGGGSPSYQWKLNGTNVGSNSTTYVSSSLVDGDKIEVTMTSANTSNNCGVTSIPIYMTINPYAVVTKTSASGTENQTVCANNSIMPVTYTLTGSGTGATVTGLPAGVGSAFANGTSTISGAPTAAGTFIYTVTANGTCTAVPSVLTGTITVGSSVVASVAVTKSAPTNTICAGTSVTFTATPTGGGTPTYQWKNGGALVGINSNTYTTTTLANTDAISVLMTSSLGCAAPWQSTSTPITMYVNSPVNNNIISTAQTICTGSTPTNLAGTTAGGGNGSAYAYVWQSSATASTGPFANASGTYTVGATYTTSSLTATKWYRRYVTSGACAADTSLVVTITVNPLITNNTISSAQSICSGVTPLPLSGSIPAGGNGAYTYQWKVSTTSSTAGFGPIGGATSQDYSPGSLSASTWYKRLVTSAPCATDSTSAIKMTISPNLVASVTITATATTICNGTSVVFTPAITDGGSNPTYQWTDNGSNITGEVYNTYTTSSLVDGHLIRAVLTSDASPCLTGSPATSNAITMKVNAIPTATVSVSTQTICSGGSFTTMTLGTNPSVGTTTFAWTRDNTSTVTGIAASGTGDIGGVILNSSSSASQIVVFTIVPTNTVSPGCPGTAITATVVVNAAAPGTPTVISGVDTTYVGFVEPYSTPAVTNATSYTWTVPACLTITGGATTNAITVSATATGTGNITVRANNSCNPSATISIPVTVLTPTVAITTPCQGTTVHYATQYREGVSYRWSVPSDWTIIAGGSDNAMTVVAGAASGNITVTEFNSCGDGTVRTLALTPNPRPVVTTNSGYSCSGTAVNLALTGTPAAATTYQWVATDNAGTSGESLTTQTGPTINNTITNTASGINTVVYTVTSTVTGTGCANTQGGISPQTLTVTVNPDGYWTGNADTNWFNTGNWCTIPDCSHDAYIPSTPSGNRYPEIYSNGAVCRDLTISTGASLTTKTTYSLSVCGNWLNNGTYMTNSGKIIFTGAGNQTAGGVTDNYFYNLEINKPSAPSGSDNVTLSQPAWVANQLRMTDGILATDNTNLLTITNSATTATDEGNAGSFVSGPMRWNGLNGAGNSYVFPTGKAPLKWARIGIQALTDTSDFQAEHFNVAWSNTSAADMAQNCTPVLKNVSHKEYWHLFRIQNGTGYGDGKVSLYWESASASGINNCPNLKIAHWDPSNATNTGGTMGSWEINNRMVTTVGSCGGATSGTITTNSVVNEFSPFTFGDTTENTNPLPVELLYFHAKYNGSSVDATWQTASEINNDYFTVERSVDGVNFYTVGVIVPSKAKGGNSTSMLTYSMNDDKVSPGVYYYRLKQTDFNGEYKYSSIDVVEIKGDANFTFNIAPNPSDGTALNSIISAEKGQEIIIVVYDVLGQELYSKVIVTEQKGNAIYAIDLLQKLSPGVYFITATSNQKVYSKRLIVN
jgi:PKD-like domain